MGALVNAGVAVLAAATLAGCGSMGGSASMRPGVAASPCSGADMPVTISQINASAKTIELNPDPRPIPMTAAGVTWILSGQYVFTDDGITFTGYPNNPASGPSVWGPDSGGRQYVVCFGDTTSLGAATWNYRIRFKSTTTPVQTWECDPTIINSSALTHKLVQSTVSCTVTP